MKRLIPLGWFVLLIGCSTPEPTPTPPPLNLGPSPEEVAHTLAQATVHTGKQLAQSNKEPPPTPHWGRFPNMVGTRLRTPLQRTQEGKKVPKPVLFLMLDTTRADYLSSYGYARETTPNIDSIAAEGIRFSRFYANAPWTRPSVASMMLSQYRSTHNIENGKVVMFPEEKTLAEVFKGAGYATAAFVGNRTVNARRGFAQGFDTFSDDWGEQEVWPRSSLVVNDAIAWFKGNTNPNWLMWLFLVDPHDPYMPDKPHDKWRSPGTGKWIKTPPIEVKKAPPNRYLTRLKELYAGELRQTDTAIGSLISYLKTSGIWDQVTVVIVADHGEMMGEHRSFRHSYHFWEPNINVPCILRTPWLKESGGLVEDRLFQGIDIAPTLLDLAGVDSAGWPAAGISAAQVMTGPIARGWDRAVYAETNTFGITRWMVRQGKYKYLRFNPTQLGRMYNAYKTQSPTLTSVQNTTVKEHLYDLEADPHEQNNILETQPKLTQAMRVRLKQFRARSATDEPIDVELADEVKEELRELGYIE